MAAPLWHAMAAVVRERLDRGILETVRNELEELHKAFLSSPGMELNQAKNRIGPG